MTLATSTHARANRRRRTDRLTVAVTGARGTIGPSLLARLHAAAEVGDVRALGRTPLPEAGTAGEVAFHAVDVRDADALSRAVAGADVVIHMAFSLYGVRERESELFATNVEGTANVARAAVATGARRFVYTSSAAVYGPRPGQSIPMDEDEPFRASPRLFYARHKAQAELVLRDLLADAEIEAFVLRPCAIVGPHAAGAPARLLPPAVASTGLRAVRVASRLGARPAVPAPPVALQFVHEDDVAQAVELAALGRGVPGAYNLAGEDVLDGRDAVRTFGLRPLPLPRAAVAQTLRLAAAVPPIVPATGWPSLISAPILIDTTRARNELGWRPRFSSAGALADTRRAAGW